MIINTLSPSTYTTALSYLSKRDNDLKIVIDKYGTPPMWSRDPGFPTLIYIILEQQVSLASAKATFEKLKKHTSPLTPETFLKIDDHDLNKIGFSRQKISYCRNISREVLDGTLRLNEFSSMPDNEIRSELLKITGIGPWTADIYLLMALNRPDIWPLNDLALISALVELKNLPYRPDNTTFERMGDSWKPWRAVAARILWHYYLSSR